MLQVKRPFISMALEKTPRNVLLKGLQPEMFPALFFCLGTSVSILKIIQYTNAFESEVVILQIFVKFV